MTRLVAERLRPPGPPEPLGGVWVGPDGRLVADPAAAWALEMLAARDAESGAAALRALDGWSNGYLRLRRERADETT